ncbi:ABC transporter permease [Agrobacterium tumefaciens]|uniref:ABC transporter permease n=1 Tax=Agrobacterium tumefaciens TaxID=358 RepID=UPI001574B8AA|nr:ABC transporter permease [Agrobacterium tumefaciens]NTD87745.1 ABC transporter permease [Agrobacterium tumefaciens]NTD91828.1 ABC transporter permease [Agrobacterium tumefaciens]NTD98360.1 ABC transporter permease [Agrobacterium tumefaciens]NTE16148.1 ABC transporter permease [Agrobacterium tumefaciens]NTE21314.1 ABC transporter permease [Agrobacterium tumefaciens]
MNGMTFGLVELSIAGGLVLLSAAVSLAMSLGLHRQILVSAARMVLQLWLIGLVFRTLFESSSKLSTAILLAVMVVAATYEVGARQKQRVSGIWHFLISGAAVSISTILITAFALATLATTDDWTSPRVIIPITGIILGTSMNSASVALNTLFNTIASQRAAIEAQLALGCSKRQALAPSMRTAIHAGTIPIMNQMAGAGIITLPGIMSGQILAGQEPMSAAQSQIFLMFLLCAASVASIMIAVFLGGSRLTDDRHRLRLDRFRQIT